MKFAILTLTLTTSCSAGIYETLKYAQNYPGGQRGNWNTGYFPSYPGYYYEN
jgi:hypothetical protein